MASIEVRDLKVAFRREGHGLTVLLIHGFVGDGKANWGDWLVGLSDAYTVVLAPVAASTVAASKRADLGSWRRPG